MKNIFVMSLFVGNGGRASAQHGFGTKGNSTIDLLVKRYLCIIYVNWLFAAGVYLVCKSMFAKHHV